MDKRRPAGHDDVTILCRTYSLRRDLCCSERRVPMPSDTPRLSGLRSITGGLVEEFLGRPAGRSRELPIVVALGARGTGKTALLHELADRCQNVPHAWIDFEKRDREDIQPRELLGHLAFDLGRHWRQFGRLAFPRLWLCMLVASASVETADRRIALKKVRELLAKNQPLEQNRDAIVEVVRLAGGIVGGQSVPGWPEATELLLRGLGWYDRRRLLGKIKALPESTGNREDFLIEIAQSAQGDDEDRATADATFCDAFLADLRQAYSGIGGSRRTLNCAVLLDNTHSPGGQAFLRTLCEARNRAEGEADPLAVFTTSRTWNPDWNEGWYSPTTHRGGDQDHRRPSTHRTDGIAWPNPRKPAEVERDWASDTEHPQRRWSPWYLIELGTLSAEDAVSLAAAREIHPSSRLPAFVHELADGHPGAIGDVLDAVTHRYDREHPTGLRGTLDSPVWSLAGEESALAAAARDYLLQDFAPTSRQDLITASAARDVEMLFHKEILDLRTPAGEGALFKALGDNLWLRAEPGETPQYVLHPWLRRILLRELAARGDEHELNWDRVHTMCREFYEKSGRTVVARYHDMALGDFAAVVAHLRGPFDSRQAEFDVPGAEAWLAELDIITAAPNRLDKYAAPYDQVQDLVGQWGDELETTLAWLVVSLWVSHDPLGDPGGTLNTTIETGFHQLAQGRGRGAMLLHERAERYRL